MKKTINYKLLKLTAVFVILLVVIVIAKYVVYESFNTITRQQKMLINTQAVMANVDVTMAQVFDSASALRAFALSKDVERLKNYHDAVNVLPTQSRQLLSLVAKDSDRSAKIQEFTNLIEKRINGFEEFLELYKDNKIPNKTTVTQFLQNDVMVMESIRTVARDIKLNEQQLLDQKNLEVKAANQNFIISLLINLSVFITILIFSLALVYRNESKQEQEVRKTKREADLKGLVNQFSAFSLEDVSLEKYAKNILQFLTKKYNIAAGRIFITEQNRIVEISNLATDIELSANHLKEQTDFIQSSMTTQDLKVIDNIPSDFWKIKTTLGEAIPNKLILYPLWYKNQKLGLIEMATFSSLSDEDLEELQYLQETMALNIQSVQSQENTIKLLAQTQTMAEELQSQQEELRTTNEELEQQAQALEIQNEVVNNKKIELERVAYTLGQKTEELKLANQHKSEFLAKMSHELRTPLNGLLILSSLLHENKENNLTEQQQQFAQSIYNSGNDLLLLINDILDLSKIEARKLRVFGSKTNLKDSLEQFQTSFKPQAKAKGLEFKLEIDDKIKDLTLYTDRQRMEQIIRNLLSNAVKFTQQGQIVLKAGWSENHSDNIEIDVIDSGIGIPREKLNMIFEAFEQVDGSVSRRFGGTGLGLTISRELAGLLGGKIEISSQEGQGSTFKLTLPVRIPESSLIDSQPSPSVDRQESNAKPGLTTNLNQDLFFSSENQTSQELKLRAKSVIQKIDLNKKCILVVEDDEKFRQSVVSIVEGFDFQVVQAEDGEMAMALLENFTPNAILLDIKLPGISGMGILEMTKNISRLRHVPVHMISALDYQQNALRMGALGYLAKPVTADKIRSAMERIQHILNDNLRRVLIVEDDSTQLEAMTSLIASPNTEIISRHSGLAALEVLNTTSVDCIILDLSLPDLSGFDFLEKLNLLQVSLPPVIVYTGKDLSASEEEKLMKFSQSIIIKGARSPERLLDEVNLFLHRVDSITPEERKTKMALLRTSPINIADKTVLLVDDDLRNLFALTSALEAKGMKVITAKDGLEALTSLEKHNGIDLVLTDIMMPNMDGYETMKAIRSHSDVKIRKLPIIALTAKAMKEDHEKCVASGANDYLTKPINLENLYNSMNIWLKPQRLFDV